MELRSKVAVITFFITQLIGVYAILVVPHQIPFKVVQPAFEKIIDADAALLGFTGVIVAVCIQTWKERVSHFIRGLFATVLLLLVSLVDSMVQMVVGAPVSVFTFLIPIDALIMGVIVLFHNLVLGTHR